MITIFLICFTIILTVICTYMYSQSSPIYRSTVDMFQKTMEYEKKIAILETENRLLKQQLLYIENNAPESFKNIAQDVITNMHEKHTISYASYWDLLHKKIEDKVSALQHVISNKREEDIALQTSIQQTFATLNSNTQQLIETIRGGSSHQGIWGEQILYKMLEESGLIKNKDFFIQKNISIHHATSDKKFIRPDVVVMLPNNKCIAIDAKTSLLNVDETDSSDAILDRTSKNYIRHIKELCNKKYQAHIEGSLDFMIVFIPFDNLFLQIQHTTPNIIRIANASNIVLASPSIIIPLLKMVENAWQYDHNTKHLHDILQDIKDLIQSLQQCDQKLTLIGNTIGKAAQQVTSLKQEFSGTNQSLCNKALRIDNQANIITEKANLKLVQDNTTYDYNHELPIKQDDNDSFNEQKSIKIKEEIPV